MKRQGSTRHRSGNHKKTSPVASICDSGRGVTGEWNALQHVQPRTAQRRFAAALTATTRSVNVSGRSSAHSQAAALSRFGSSSPEASATTRRGTDGASDPPPMDSERHHIAASRNLARRLDSRSSCNRPHKCEDAPPQERAKRKTEEKTSEKSQAVRTSRGIKLLTRVFVFDGPALIVQQIAHWLLVECSSRTPKASWI